MYWKTPEDLGISAAEKNALVEKVYAEAKETATRPCPDCGVEPGKIHHGACDVARCGGCGGQAISCGCGDLSVTDVWTGLWPGYQECYEQKLICCHNPGEWQFDLNTLASKR